MFKKKVKKIFVNVYRYVVTRLVGNLNFRYRMFLPLNGIFIYITNIILIKKKMSNTLIKRVRVVYNYFKKIKFSQTNICWILVYLCINYGFRFTIISIIYNKILYLCLKASK